MSLNLGNEAIRALRTMHTSESARPLLNDIRDAIGRLANKAMNDALEDVNPGSRLDSLGYAKALRDVCIAFESAATETKMNQLEKPGPVAKRGAE